MRALDGNKVKQLPKHLNQWLAACSIFAWIIGVAVVTAFAMIHKSIDYTLFEIHPQIYPRVLAISLFFSACAMLLSLKREGSSYCRSFFSEPAVLLFGVVAVWIFFSAIATKSFDYFFYPQEVRGESAFRQAYYLLFLFPSAVIITDEDIKKWILRAFLLLSIPLFVAALVLWHTQNQSNYFPDWYPAFTSIYANSNYYGYMLAMFIPISASLFLEEKSSLWKRISLALLLLNLVALAINNTMGAWVAVVFSIAFLLIIRLITGETSGRRLIYASIAVLVCLVIAGIAVAPLRQSIIRLFSDVAEILSSSDNAGQAGSGRWAIWVSTIEYIRTYPLFGIGFEGVLVKEIGSIIGSPRPHNEYFQYALFYGIPAAIAYCAGCFSVFYRAVINKAIISKATITALTGAFGYLVSALFGVTLFYITPFMFILLGLGYAEKNKCGIAPCG